MNLGPAGIPNLVRLLDGLIADNEPDVPKANDGSVFGVVLGRFRVLLHQTRLTLDGSGAPAAIADRESPHDANAVPLTPIARTMQANLTKFRVWVRFIIFFPL